MPQRRILIPEVVVLIDPDTNQPSSDPRAVLTFEAFLQLLFANPLWNEGIKAALAQRSILKAYERAFKDGVLFFEIAEDDWEPLVHAARQPRTAIMTPTGMQIMPGLGLTPRVAWQLVPLYQAIINAEQFC